MNKRLLTVAAFALAGCVTVAAQVKKEEMQDHHFFQLMVH